MRKLILAGVLILAQQLVTGQGRDTLFLRECLIIAETNSPLIQQKQISNDILHNKIRNLSTNWYPSIGINAQAIYNSEAIDFSDIIKNIPVSLPELPLDQYKIWAEINQQLFDGGVVRAQKQMENLIRDADIQKTESDLLAVRQQVNQVYFSLLGTRKSKEILEVSLSQLSERKNAVKSAVDNGAVLPDNLFALDAEEITLQQKIAELNSSEGQLLEMMSIILDTSLSHEVVLGLPRDTVWNEESIERPEYRMFDKQKEILAANQKLVNAADMPKFFAFSQLAYGRPGFNMVSDEFHTFYNVGLGMKWNLLNYGDSKRQKTILEKQKELIEVSRENFNDRLHMQLSTEYNNIEKYDQLMEKDSEILKLRSAIALASMSKLNHGIITSADYLQDMNAEILARLQFENHKILKMQAIYNYLLLQGKL